MKLYKIQNWRQKNPHSCVPLSPWDESTVTKALWMKALWI